MPEKDPGTGELKEAEEGLRTILPPRDDAPPVVEPREHAPDRGQHARTGLGVEGLHIRIGRGHDVPSDVTKGPGPPGAGYHRSAELAGSACGTSSPGYSGGVTHAFPFFRFPVGYA
jgi:hypothetical protein